MLQKTAVIIKSNADYIWLNNPRTSSCGHCQQSDCGVGILNKAGEQWFNRQQSTRFKRPDNAWGQQLKTGDTVLICATEKQMLQAALWLYLWPLLCLLGSAIAYQILAGALGWRVSDIISTICGFTGLLMGFVFVKYRQKQNQHLQAKIRPVVA